jgi:transcriptional regulator with XRE-family HTH domain
MNLGKTIKDLRKDKGIKQLQLAESCSITQSYLSNIESNKKEPTLSVLNQICTNLSVPLPIVFFLSMGKEDVAENKREIFDTLAPLMKETLLKSFA